MTGRAILLTDQNKMTTSRRSPLRPPASPPRVAAGPVASPETRTDEGVTRRFAEAVVHWQRRHGRHDLPWQGTTDPYRIWLSEIMLQQTQVTAVIPYYARFLTRCPDIGALAAASVDEVMQLWSGLGYYSRARNLHAAARRVAAQHGGVFPRGFEEVVALPGVGRSTAAAICAFAYGDRRAILDGNVKRVLCRVFGVEGFPGAPAVERSLWQLAESLLPETAIEAYTQGLMDLGATLCTRSRPRCDACPLAADCVARRDGRIGGLPAARPRKERPVRSRYFLILHHAGEVLLERRPPTGIWGGLWSLPEADSIDGLTALVQARYGARMLECVELPVVSHGFTHYQLDIVPLRIEVGAVESAARAPGLVWLPLEEVGGAALPAPVRTLLQAQAKSGMPSAENPRRRPRAGRAS